MARLEQALQLRQLVQRLAACDPDQGLDMGVVYASLTKLQRSRPSIVASLRQGLICRTAHKINHSKLNLWAALAKPAQADSRHFRNLLSTVKQTDAWTQACDNALHQPESLALQPWGYKARIQNAD